MENASSSDLIAQMSANVARLLRNQEIALVRSREHLAASVTRVDDYTKSVADEFERVRDLLNHPANKNFMIDAEKQAHLHRDLEHAHREQAAAHEALHQFDSDFPQIAERLRAGCVSEKAGGE